MPEEREPGELEEDRHLENKLFRVTEEARRAFDMLRGEVGPRSGPRLIAEAIDLLLLRYGKHPVGPFRAARASPSAPKHKPTP
jgi:hypothetical protein